MRLKVLLPALLFTQAHLHSQQPVGHWRDHLPYHSGQYVVSTHNKVYCVANQNLFYYNKKDASINKLNKANFLSDVGVSALAYHHGLDVLVVGFENGNIDLVDKNGNFNISAIERKNIAASKRINNIFIEGDLAYLATDFAIVVLNLKNREIKDTYYIGPKGTFVQVKDICLDNENIYAMKTHGILVADKNSPFLIDYSQWKESYTIDHDTNFYSHITVHNNKVYLAMNVLGHRNDSLFVLSNGTKQPIDLGFAADYYGLKSAGGHLLVSQTWSSVLLDDQYKTVQLYAAEIPMDADVDQDMTGWVASRDHGLIRIQGYARDTLYPDGPVNKGAYDFDYRNGAMYVAGGLPSLWWSRYGMHKYSNNSWKTINYQSDTGMAKVWNINKVIVDPADPTHVFGGSFGSGLVEFRNDKVVKVYNTQNSPLRSMDIYEYAADSYIHITGMDFDRQGNLVFVVSNITNPLFILTPEGKMYNPEFEYNGFNGTQQITEMLVSSAGHVWILMKNAGIFIYDYNGTPENQDDDRELKFNVVNQEGNPLNDVFSIAEDIEKQIWVGTGKGPVIYYNHEGYFDNGVPAGQQVALPDLENSVQFLLVSERVNSIAVDGGNRKWLGTASSGVFLVSPDGYQQIHNFRKENSPLLTNSIIDMGIDHKTGEVFFGTDMGIVSYRAEATAAGSDFGNVYVFPNPVRPGYEGEITITGLARDVNVKITDISGNLVYETTAVGGSALWNGRNFDGHRVHTGVYLVFCSNQDGRKTHVTKMVFVN
jgi:ligand-binding sensor domain-containing protein